MLVTASTIFRPPLRRLPAIVAITAIAMLLPSGCSRQPPAPETIVLVTLDTTRADRLGCYLEAQASRPSLTPVLDRLAADAFLFLNAATPTPITGPAHATIMTGLYPPAHGVIANVSARLGDDATTLAELLGEAGYETAAFVSAFVLNAQYGLAQGFEHYSDRFEVERRAGDTTDDVLAWLTARIDDRPLFLWVHYFDPHTPYDPPSGFEDAGDTPYDGEIAYMDRELGRLLDGLRSKGRYDDALILVAGDHGEGLEDHGELEHGVFLYDETVRVPFMIKLPAALDAKSERSGRRIVDQVSLADVLPTMAELVESGSSLDDGVQGYGLHDLLMKRDGRRAGGRELDEELDAGGELVPIQTLYPEVSLGWSRLQGVRSTRWKYIEAPTPELYDLEADPSEHTNLVLSRPDQVSRLAWHFEKIKERWFTGSATMEAPVGLDPATARRLRSLGYLSPSPGPAGGDSLPDPKDMMPLYQFFEDGKAHIENEEWEDAHAAFTRVLGEAPNNFVALFYAAMALSNLDRLEEANALYEVILERSPYNTEARYAFGRNLVRLERYREAIPHLERAAADNLLTYGAHWSLGIALERLGELRKAREHFHRALESPKHADSAMHHSALLSLQLGDFERAHDELMRALASHPDDPLLETSLGVVLMNLPRGDDPEPHLRRAIELQASEPIYHYNLACYFARTGRPDEALEALGAAIDRGYGNAAGIRTDPDLEAIRARPEFRTLIDRIE